MNFLYSLAKESYKFAVHYSAAHLPSSWIGTARFGIIPGIRNFGLDSSLPGDLYPGTLQINAPWTAKRKLPVVLCGTPHLAFTKEQVHELPGTAAAIVRNGRVLGNQGVTFDEDGFLLADPAKRVASSNDLPERYSIIRPKITKLTGRWGVLTGSASNGFFHWMMDVLPRAALVQSVTPQIDGWIVPKNTTRFVDESLACTGLTESKIYYIGNEEHVQADEIVVTSNPSLTGNPPPWLLDWYQSAWTTNLKQPTAQPEFILVSRKKGNRRTIINEDQLLDSLSPFSFKQIILEDLSLAEQAHCFANAKLIVSPHGAGLTNLIHSNKNTTVLEIFGEQYVNVCFWAISTLRSLKYSYLIGPSIPSRFSADKSTWNIQLTTENIEAICTWVKCRINSLS